MEYYLYEVVTKKLGDERYLQKADYIQYTLPVATASELGGIKVGDGLAITSTGVLSANVQAWNSLTGKPFTSVSTTDFVVSNGLLNINSSTWAKKTDLSTYYTKSEINDLFSSLKKATITVVSSLPSTGEEGIIYFVGDKAPYEQYVYESGIGWISLGSTEIDLTPYVQGSDLTADTIILGNGSKKIKTSSKKITTTLGNDDTTLPTSKAVKANIESSVNNAVVNLSTAIAKKQDKITGNYPIDFTGNQISLNVHSYDNYLSSDGSFKNILSLQSGDWLSNVAIFELTDTAFEIYQVDGDTYAMEQYGQIATALQTYFQTNFDNNKQIAQILVLQGSDTVNALIRTKASVKKALAQSLLFKCMYAHINSNDVGFNAIYKADWTFVNDDGYIEELQIYLQVAYDGSEDSQTVILDGITTSKIYQ